MKKTQIDTVYNFNSLCSLRLKNSVAIKYFLPLVLLAFALPAFADETLPTAQDINEAAQKAKQIYDTFFSQTFEMRMQYEYSGRFLNPADKDTLSHAAKQASVDLEQIADKQTAMKKAIEAYQKDDWETLFGQTGLWRKLSADLTHTQTSKLEIDYRLARIEGKTSSQAEKQYFMQMIRSDWAWCEAIKLSIEKIKCLGLSEPNGLDNTAWALAKSECNDNPEFLLSLAILQNKYAPDKLQNTLSRSASATELFGKIILADLSSGSDINSLNPLTAELAAYAASNAKSSANKEVLLAIANSNKLKTPGTLSMAGKILIESDPAKAISLLIESSDLQLRQNEPLLDINAAATSEYAARLAYDNFTQNKIDCNTALSAFDNYVRITSNQMTEEMQFHYGEILLESNKAQDASAIFTKLADGPKSIWHDKAAFELLKIKISYSVEETLPQLRTFILNCTGQDEQKRPIRLEAMVLYCRISIAYDSNEYASQVLNLLDTAERTPGLQYDLYRAQAMRQLGRLEESAQYMSKALFDDSSSMVPAAARIASDIIDKIELWQKDANDFNELLRNCAVLADFAHKSANSYQTNLLWAEVSLIEGKKVEEPLPSNNEDVLWLRVQARLLMQEEKFDQSAKLWAKIAESRRNEQNQKSYGWWQAKYYELDCLAKSPQADKQNIAHAIDVLISTYPQIPAPWPEKLDLLKKQCSAN
jgi:hypothetical protein